MRVLLLYKEDGEGFDELRDELRLLFSKINAGFDAFALSSGGEGEDIFPALLRRLGGKFSGGPGDAAPTHAVVLSMGREAEFSSRIFIFLSGFACGSGLPVAVCGEEAAASIPAGLASSFKVLKNKASLNRYLKKEREAEKKRGASGEAGAARDSLLQAGIPVTKESLFRCVREGMVREVSLFFAAGFSPDARDEAGVALLNMAARAKNPDMLRALIDAGAQVNSLAADRGSSALLDAVMLRRPDLLRILMEAGADINLKTKDGQSALIIAVGAGDAACTEILLKAGADPDDADALGASARKYAVLFHNTALMALFDTYAPPKAG
jgi:hypothetical protein